MELLNAVMELLNALKPVIAVPLIGIIVIAGAIWQEAVCERDYYTVVQQHSLLWVFKWETVNRYYDPTPRLGPSLGVGLVIVVGALTCALFSFLRKEINPETFGECVFKAGVFYSLFIAKAYFAPLLTALGLAGSVYCLLIAGEIHSVPILTPLVDWLFSGLPEFFQTVYYVFLIGFLPAYAIYAPDALSSARS